MTNTQVPQEQILHEIAKIIEDVAQVPTDEVTMDKSFTDDLEVDSLSLVEIAAQAEDRFEIDVRDEDLANLLTVGDVVDHVHKTRS